LQILLLHVLRGVQFAQLIIYRPT